MWGTQECVFRFGDVEVREREFRLIKAGEVIPVEPKAFRVLLFLLHNPQKLITKEELLNAVWGETAVSENSLARSIALLRRLLGENSHEPRFIETVSTVGYRLVCPVDVSKDEHGCLASPNSDHVGNVTERSQLDRASSEAVPSKLSARKNRINRRRWMLAATALVVGFLALVAWYIFQPLPSPRVSEYVQLTNDPRWEKFVIGSDNSRIYVGLNPTALGQLPQTGGEITVVPISVPGAKPLDQRWLGDISPDGTSLFVAGADHPKAGGSDQWIVGTSGTPVRYLGRGFAPSWWPDGKQVIYSTPNGDVYAMPSSGGESHRLLASPGSPPFWFDFSHDGSRVRFSRDGKLWEMSSSGTNLHEILRDMNGVGIKCCGHWTADGDFYVFEAETPISSDNARYRLQLWATDERHGRLRRPIPDPIQLTFGPNIWAWPIPSKEGKKIFATCITHGGELIRFDKAGQPRRFLGGISAEMLDFSRDGNFIVYASYPDSVLWLSKRDGSEAQQLAKSRVYATNPRWSPDGTQIVYVDSVPRTSEPTSASDAMFIVSSQGGTPVRVLPDDKESEGDPTWSPDGKQLAYWSESAEGKNETETRVLDLATHKITYLQPPPIRTFSPRWSPDGRYIVCITGLWPHSNGLELYDLNTQKWTVLVQGLGTVGWPAWSYDSRSIYFMGELAADYSGGQRNWSSVFRISVNGGTIDTILDLKDFRGAGILGESFSLDPDDNPLLLRNAGTNEIYALTLEMK